MEEKLDFLTEALGLFVRHQLTLTAHQPTFDPETQRLGRLRYDEFAKAAGRLAARTASAEPRPDRSLGRVHTGKGG
ncbi:hypothetical protein GCM10011494_07670 [Novosphingobium endophyticum]|uniref:Uncharacterized protein n=1 Tax=Novosphingobium endophyticum TaxID=1955250 RepID=A0A916TQM3_9SPHN|nr:hypothetical protein [Novosphingobium endophyticum]GGB91775.1 hypothetical protein GCM10011494_07670 [Novosphingobium endophyticum]